MHLFDPGTGEDLTVDRASTRRIIGMGRPGASDPHRVGADSAFRSA